MLRPVRKTMRRARRRPSSKHEAPTETPSRWIPGTSRVSRMARDASASLLPSGRSCGLAFEVRPSFALSLNEKDLGLLESLQAFFGCGWIRASKADSTYKYEVRSLGDHMNAILPHLERFPLRGYNAGSCAGFCRVCRMMEQGHHLQRQGLREIIAVAYQMNLGKRRYSQATLLRVLDEVKG